MAAVSGIARPATPRPPSVPVAAEQSALPFGDVDEFPSLLSAAGGLVALHGASCQYSSSATPRGQARSSGSEVCVCANSIRNFFQYIKL